MKLIVFILLFLSVSAYSINITDTAVNPKNRSLMFIESSGKYFARSEPEFPFELTQKGETKVYQIENGDDWEVYSFDWYCRNVYLTEFDNTLYTARVNSAHYGILASHRDTCLSLYKKDKLIKSYTTLDLAKHPNNVYNYSEFYSVIRSANGFSRGDFPFNNHKIFFSFYVKGYGYIRIDIETGKYIHKYDKCDIAKPDFDPSMLIYQENPEEN